MSGDSRRTALVSLQHHANATITGRLHGGSAGAPRDVSTLPRAGANPHPSEELHDLRQRHLVDAGSNLCQVVGDHQHQHKSEGRDFTLGAGQDPEHLGELPDVRALDLPARPMPRGELPVDLSPWVTLIR